MSAGGNNEVSVELRLALDKLQGDIKKAVAQMKSGLSADLGGAAAAGTNKAAQAQDTLGKATEKTTSKLKAQKAAADAALQAWRAANPGGVAAGMKITDANVSTSSGKPSGPGPILNPGVASSQNNLGSEIPKAQKRLTAGLDKERANIDFWAKNGRGYGLADIKARGFTTPQLPTQQFPALPMRGTPPKLPKAPAASGGGLHINMTQISTLTSAMGLSGLGSAVLGPLGVAAAAVVIGLMALRKVAQETAQAVNEGMHRYSKSLQSGGLPTSFTTKRTLLAQTLGVGEEEVYNFGKQIAWLNPQLQRASTILAATTTPLAGVSMRFSVLGANLKALFADITDAIGPALTVAAIGLSAVVKGLIDVFDQLKNKLFEVGLAAALITGGKKGMDAFMKATMVGVSGYSGKNAPPAPQPFMKQLGASAWEHMGLLIGGGNTNNHAAETAKNTKATADILKKMAQKMAQPSAGGQIRYNMP